MKARNRKLLSVATILVAFAVAGCATSKSYDAVAPVPSFETEEQLAAATVCEAVYSCCARACSDTRSLDSEAAGAECMAACSTSLDECYEACE